MMVKTSGEYLSKKVELREVNCIDICDSEKLLFIGQKFSIIS
jgi:hypothetical protein